MNENRNQVIATEIKQQLGWQCLFLLGAKNFIGDEVEKAWPAAALFRV